MHLRLTSSALVGAVTLLVAGCAGGAVEGAPESVALVRGTTLADGIPLNSCLDKAGFNIKDAAGLADGVRAKKFGNGETFHVVTVTSGDKQIQFTVIPDRQFVLPYDDASDALLEQVGCAVDGDPLNERST